LFFAAITILGLWFMHPIKRFETCRAGGLDLQGTEKTRYEDEQLRQAFVPLAIATLAWACATVLALAGHREAIIPTVILMILGLGLAGYCWYRWGLLAISAL